MEDDGLEEGGAGPVERLLQAASVNPIGWGLAALGMLLGCSTLLGGATGGCLVPAPASSLADLVARSGVFVAFSLVFVSEIGDRTFFIAALLAMKLRRQVVIVGAMSALALMTVISVVIGSVLGSVPSFIETQLPVGGLLAGALLTVFGVQSLVQAWRARDGAEFAEAQETLDEETLDDERLEEETLDAAAGGGAGGGGVYSKFLRVFSLIFMAEWGDRSMFAVIALAAAQNPVGVTVGACLGHLVATSIAVMGGAVMAKYLSERVVSGVGGVLFLGFAAATILETLA